MDRGRVSRGRMERVQRTVARVALLLCVGSLSGVHGSSSSFSSSSGGSHPTGTASGNLAGSSGGSGSGSYIGGMSGKGYAAAASVPHWPHHHADCMAACLHLCDDHSGACAEACVGWCAAAESVTVEAHHHTAHHTSRTSGSTKLLHCHPSLAGTCPYHARRPRNANHG